MQHRTGTPKHHGSFRLEPWRPSDPDRKVAAPRGKPTCRRCRLMVGQQLPTEIGWQGEHRGRGLTLNAFVATLSASRARHADGPPHTPRDAEVLAFEAGCQTAKARSKRSSGKAARFTCAARPATTTRRHARNGPARRPAAGQGPGPGLTCPRALLMRRRTRCYVDARTPPMTWRAQERRCASSLGYSGK